VALALLAFAGCPADMTEEKAELAKLSTDWEARLQKAQAGLKDLEGKVKALQGADDAALAEPKATLDRTLANASAAVAEAGKTLTTSKAAIEAGISSGKSAQAQVALSTGRSTIEGAIARAESLVTAGHTALKALEQRQTEAKAAAERLRAQVEAFKQAADDAVKKKGASFDVAGVAFAGEALDAAASKTALDSLTGFFKTCPQLKADLALTATGEAEGLGSKRAEALKAALLAAGVDAKALDKVTGTNDEADKLTVTVTAPCK
jgi:chromosome segregation ATPase